MVTDAGVSLLAFDIETTGLDPLVDSITSAAVFGSGYAAVIEARDEACLIELIAQVFEQAGPVTIVGRNSAVFDFRFLYARCRAIGVPPFVGLAFDPQIAPKYDPLPGFLGGYDVVVSTDRGSLRHVDIAYRYKSWAEMNQVPWSLKPVARAHGIEMIEVDRAHMGLLTTPERMAYNLSDVVGTHALAEKLGDIAVGDGR